MATVGLVGAGRMGRAMIGHLRKAGHAVRVADVSPEALEAAAALGATPVGGAGETAAGAEAVFVAVGFDEECAETLRGPDGVFAAAAPGTIVIVNSTIAPALAIALGREAEAAGLRLLDVPICRGAKAADEGTLLAVAGGAGEALADARPLLGCFCSDIAHVGEVGHGQVAKAVNNLLLWVDGVALLEAGRLAESTGIDLKVLREALLMSSGRSWALQNWDSVTFRWALKDMQVVLGMCDEAGGSFPMLGFVKEQVKDGKAVKARGEGPGWT
jgi:3-hydroxyisobutyrate dehydrogenase and related beta-hydroxyacid dehydrogenases